LEAFEQKFQKLYHQYKQTHDENKLLLESNAQLETRLA
jgi:hypothetical protein